MCDANGVSERSVSRRASCQEKVSIGYKAFLCHKLWVWSSELAMPSKMPRSFNYYVLHLKAREA
jgi:hypothetical protein